MRGNEYVFRIDYKLSTTSTTTIVTRQTKKPSQFCCSLFISFSRMRKHFRHVTFFYFVRSFLWHGKAELSTDTHTHTHWQKAQFFFCNEPWRKHASWQKYTPLPKPKMYVYLHFWKRLKSWHSDADTELRILNTLLRLQLLQRGNNKWQHWEAQITADIF